MLYIIIIIIVCESYTLTLIMSDDDADCIFCGLLVNSVSYGIECDNCQSWTHIECDTGKSIF